MDEDFDTKLAGLVHSTVSSANELVAGFDILLADYVGIYKIHRKSLEVIRTVMIVNSQLTSRLYQENQEIVDVLEKILGPLKPKRTGPLMTEKRSPEEVSTDSQKLNEVYDAKVEELDDDKERTFQDIRADREKLDREYWVRVEALNLEWEQLMKKES